MNLIEKIEAAFARRQIPSEVITPENYIQFDSDVEDALSFAGKDWHEITSEHWRKHHCAAFFLSPKAFAYYLPSLLILQILEPQAEPNLAVDSLISSLDRSPSADGWDDHFRSRFLGLTSEEYGVIKEWLLYMSETATNYGWGDSASGPGEIFGRAFDTVCLLQKETKRQNLIEEKESGTRQA